MTPYHLTPGASQSNAFTAHLSARTTPASKDHGAAVQQAMTVKRVKAAKTAPRLQDIDETAQPIAYLRAACYFSEQGDEDRRALNGTN